MPIPSLAICVNNIIFYGAGKNKMQGQVVRGNYLFFLIENENALKPLECANHSLNIFPAHCVKPVTTLPK